MDPAVLMIPPTLDGTASPALDTLHTDGCTTPALTNTDIFDGSPHMAYLDSGNQLAAVLKSPATLDELEVATGHLNGAVAGSKMTVTHTGILRLAPGIDLPAVVCPEIAANLIGMLPMLNTCPALTLTIEAAAAGAHVCIVRDSRTNAIVFCLREDRGVLPVRATRAGHRAIGPSWRASP